MLKDGQYDANVRLAQLAVESNHLSQQQSDEALDAWREGAGGKDFGMFLVANQYLASDTLWDLTRARDQQSKRQPESELASVSTNGTATAALSPVAAAHAIKKQNGATAPAAEPGTAPRQAPSTGPRPSLDFDENTTLADLLGQAMALKASDLHIHAGAPLSLRLGGELVPASESPLSEAAGRRLVLEALDDSQARRLEAEHQLDFAFELPGVGRFRANAYCQQRGLDAVFRTIPPQPPTLTELGMPKDLERIADFHQGLVLFTGPAGCGKSSTMAAMVRLINEKRPDHILTIEDPVEYVHTSATCNVNQRQVGEQTESFPRALRAALREDPDVIVIGELRDLETISLAITAAETGHLVLGTLHTSNAIRTINRLLAVFPPGQQAQIRVMLSESLKAVISQRLVRRADGRGRVAAVEVMLNNSAIGNLIRDNKTFQIKSVLQTGGNQGQRLLDGSLADLLKDKAIKQEEAMRHADDPAAFR